MILTALIAYNVNPGFGELFNVEHDRSLVCGYAHIRKISADVLKGGRVSLVRLFLQKALYVQYSVFLFDRSFPPFHFGPTCPEVTIISIYDNCIIES